jgi:hypothetical protein
MRDYEGRGPRQVMLARHFREAEGLLIGQIAERLGRSLATVKVYFYDPTGEKSSGQGATRRSAGVAATARPREALEARLMQDNAGGGSLSHWS